LRTSGGEQKAQGARLKAQGEGEGIRKKFVGLFPFSKANLVYS